MERYLVRIIKDGKADIAIVEERNHKAAAEKVLAERGPAKLDYVRQMEEKEGRFTYTEESQKKKADANRKYWK